ncbi:MAG: hypothetical protein IT186_16255 [Acidobacteria bacterium]|nr:hypothetical protein [Acidobacteriota bacterium]MCG3195387.1 Glutathione-binding protein GsiB [Thermoanaerobaculia bacterium]MCK6682571.1 ABC transporter substrate-binding protein [Thermoanaerobaculia bacterium]
MGTGFALLLSACRRGPDGPNPSGGTQARITVSVPHDPETLDPHSHDRLAEFVFSSQLFEPLVKTDADMGIAPSLAARWVNPDLLTWIFHLRPSVKFHDGRPLTAADVVYSIDRLRQHPELENSVYALRITSVKALDDLTVEIKTTHPMSLLLNKLSLVHIVPAGSAQTLASAPVGTGPYKLSSWTPGTSIRLTRFEGYWGEKPKIEEATFLLGRSPDEATTDIVTGRAQIAQNPSRSREGEVARNSNLSLFRRTGNFLVHAAFNLSSDRISASSSEANPFRKRDVRKAVSLAIDRPRLAAALPSFAVPASQLVPTFIFGHNPSLPELPFDPAEAKALLAKAGHAEGFVVALHTRKILADAARGVQPMLAEIGVRAQIVELPDSEFFRLRENGGPAFFVNRFGCTTGDASDLWDAGFHTRDENYGASNVSGYSNRDIDELIEKSSELLEAPSRRVMLHNIMTRVMDEMLWVPLYFQEDVFVTEKRYSLRPRADSVLLLSEIAVSP